MIAWMFPCLNSRTLIDDWCPSPRSSRLGESRADCRPISGGSVLCPAQPRKSRFRFSYAPSPSQGDFLTARRARASIETPIQRRTHTPLCSYSLCHIRYIQSFSLIVNWAALRSHCHPRSCQHHFTSPAAPRTHQRKKGPRFGAETTLVKTD